MPLSQAIAALLLLGLCFAVFGALGRLCPCNPGRPLFLSRSIALDLGYCLIGVVYAGAVPLGAAMLAASPLGRWAAGATAPALLALPLAGQLVLLLVATDFCQYWLHRGVHDRRLWPIHAAHHSAADVNWTTTFRAHPLNYVALNASLAMLAKVAGFSETCLLLAAPIFFFSGALTHANLNWTFGPLRYAIASPVFHRWHHANDPAGRERNFAPMFPVWDLAFGTFHMPRGLRPDVYGADGVPSDLFGQLLHPFRPGASA